MYNPCGTAIPETCASRNLSQTMPVLPCIETCECKPGEILANGNCISQDGCGCLTEDGSYIDVRFLLIMTLLGYTESLSISGFDIQ